MSRRNDISVLWGALAIALAAAPAAAEPLPVDSWGRAGVAYETYRNDSLECGLVGYYADVSQTEQAQAFVRATRQLEGADNTNYVAAGRQRGANHGRGGRPGPPIRADPPEHPPREAGEATLKRGMEAVVEDCLRERGYVEFRLTDDQRERLSKLDKGSDERREFLYSLASNPDVLDAQALPPTAS